MDDETRGLLQSVFAALSPIVLCNAWDVTVSPDQHTAIRHAGQRVFDALVRPAATVVSEDEETARACHESVMRQLGAHIPAWESLNEIDRRSATAYAGAVRSRVLGQLSPLLHAIDELSDCFADPSKIDGAKELAEHAVEISKIAGGLRMKGLLPK